ncbi:DUF2460 domain-containing protein [Amaricoccus solimangrovi]|uniref:TIGR02217 family protein n=1 Tax=Amaricoccus solimangrovi TaxID=2589815 RepID=A0A501WMQ0_9RHOB|nr:DUF2460 domain-containing protein [Amaricoccus solimangrovi]TPE50719.1 TIGR02217 family protein [Amaricoccus solimangrovi]
MNFHEVRFPAPLSMGSSGGPERRTEIVALRNGAEERNTPWRHSRRRYDAGLGVRSLDDLAEVIAFFEARRGQLYGFRWKDWADFKSCAPSARPAATDQRIGTGDGVTRAFPLAKSYGADADAYARPIRKPVAGSVSVAVAGETLVAEAFTLDPASGLVTLAEAPTEGVFVTAGFEFDVPVRFDTDRIAVSVTGFAAGEIPSVPVIEVRV